MKKNCLLLFVLLWFFNQSAIQAFRDCILALLVQQRNMACFSISSIFRNSFSILTSQIVYNSEYTSEFFNCSSWWYPVERIYFNNCDQLLYISVIFLYVFVQSVTQCSVSGVIFARMSPDQKQQLVQDLQGLGYCVGKYDFTNVHLSASILNKWKIVTGKGHRNSRLIRQSDSANFSRNKYVKKKM